MQGLVPGASGCPGIVDNTACGLLWRHAGPCLPFTPGDYLPPPTLHPLDLLMPWIRRRCPLCGDAADSVSGGVVTPARGVVLDWNLLRPEHQLEFFPCGCVGREVLHDEPARDGLVLHEVVAWLAMRKIERERAA